MIARGHWLHAAALLMLACALSAVVIAYHNARIYRAGVRLEASRNERLGEFCARTRLAVHDDREAFSSGEARARAEALARFHEGGTTYHNSASILLCIREVSAMPIYPVGCALREEWACLADFARSIEALLLR